MSTTDPDAVIARKGSLAPKLRYKNHRAVDDKHGVITAVETTAGDVEENRKTMDLIEQHQNTTGGKVKTAIADAQYGTVKNMVECVRRDIKCHMSSILKKQEGISSRKGIYGEEDCYYDRASDTYTCPAGNTLIRRKHKAKRQAYEYSTTREECAGCVLRSKCTRADICSARTIKRHYEQELLDVAIKQSMSYDAHKDRVLRKWLMEGSFADAANNHGFKRSRWRRLHKQQIQDYLIATIQNIRILIKHGIGKSPVAISNTIGVLTQILVRIFVLFGNHHSLRLN